MEPLLQHLRSVVADDREIESVLQLVSGGLSAPKPNAVEFFTKTEPPELFARLTFKDGKISDLEPGPSLRTLGAQTQLVERARHETAYTHGFFVTSRVVFSALPLAGTYSWNGELRIRPCPETAVIGSGFDWTENAWPSGSNRKHLGPPFPLLLEARIPRSPSGFLDGDRTLRALDRYQSLLGLLLAGDIGLVHWPRGRVWVPLKVEGRLENHLLTPGFVTAEDGRQDNFPECDHRPAATHDGDDYYERLWFKDPELLIPHTLNDDLNLVHSLDRDSNAAFARACYWFALAMQFRPVPAVAFVAFATAIECLLPRTKGASHPKHGKPLGPGPTKLFNEHVKRYGTVIPALEPGRARLYNARSDLVHGNRVARVDYDFFSSQRDTQEDTLLAQIVTQRSLIYWLRDPNRPA